MQRFIARHLVLVFKTNRLILREFEEADFPQLHRLVSDPQVMKYSDGPEFEPAAKRRLQAFRAMYRSHGYGKWAVERRSDGRLIGYCGFGEEIVDGVLQPELGYRFEVPVWGLGYATEAAQACTTYFFAQTTLECFFGFAHPGNRASCRVLEKIGMQFVRDSTFHESPVALYIMKRPDGKVSTK